MRTPLKAFRYEVCQSSEIGDGNDINRLRRFIYPIHDIEVSNIELAAIQRGKHGIPREGMTGGHFRKRFYRVKDTPRETGRAEGVAVSESHNIRDFGNVAFRRFGYFDAVTHTQAPDGS